MDRRRAAGALIALAACIASTAAAPTASDHTSALDLYNGTSEGCYYNFQHYGEGDRIMTNEPCLNCTCHNRMLMCYLRVCPFTKAIGQDCSVEKRADQCCPIVTCPDVPVDLLTSTSTTSPAEYGGTGVGKVDNYGCTINGKYFPEGSKVPPTPNKPCEHCYCIRNMTTCVMQECTLHVDGCTPIYHKDVCCPVRYFCDHPEDEIPLLDDMTTTVRPTEGFLLTTTTEVPTTVTQTRRECVENDQLYPDGALIKTEKPCVHCYCMKGDIVCVVQECGTPMENEGKNCTSLPPREGQCCPDTYICEGDELSTELNTELPFEDITTMQPTRRVSIEGSGYRNEPDELPYTEMPTFVTEIEGSGEEQVPEKLMPHDLLTPEQETTDELVDIMVTTTEGIKYETYPSTPRVSLSDEAEKATTEPDKGLNTVPSGISEEDSSEPSFISKTTLGDETRITEPSIIGEQDSVTSEIISEETPDPFVAEKTTAKYDTKVTEPTVVSEQSTPASEIIEAEGTEPAILEISPADESKATEPSLSEKDIVSSGISDEEKSEPSLLEVTTLYSDEKKATEPTIILEQSTAFNEISGEESTEASIIDRTTQKDESKVTDSPVTIEKETVSGEITEDDRLESTKTSPSDEAKTTMPTIVNEQDIDPMRANEDDRSEPSFIEGTTLGYIEKATEHDLTTEQNIVPSETVEEDSSKPSALDETTLEVKASEPTVITEEVTISSISSEEEKTESSILERTTMREIETKLTETPIISDEKQISDEETATTAPDLQSSSLPESHISMDDEKIATTEPTFRKEDEDNMLINAPTRKEEEEKLTTTAADLSMETDDTSKLTESYSIQTITPSIIKLEPISTTAQVPGQEVEETVKQKEPTTESFLDLSTFAHVTKLGEETATTLIVESDVVSTTPVTEKLSMALPTTINPEENEINEDVSPISSPGRIPGEGDCLLNGITYNNDSAIPSTNKCHTGCRCVSSIVKCDPIICSPPPEYMDNCQVTYDTPNSCCPTYICDHSKETIPPQPHSQMSGTESPLPSTSIQCNGDQCEVSEEKQPPTVTSETGAGESDEKPQVSECSSEGCGTETQTPTLPSQQHEDCSEGKCTPTDHSCIGDKCQQPSIKDPLLTCENPEDCKQDKLPEIVATTCEGESCIGKDQICDKEGGCEASVDKPCEGDVCEPQPAIIPSKDIPQIPATDIPLCEGESCTKVVEPPCNKEGGCDILIDKACEGENCESKEKIPPTKDIPQICENEDDCKKIPEIAVSPCEGEYCETKPEVPSKDVPQICENEEDCKKINVPDTAASPCAGDNCEKKPEIIPAKDVPEICDSENGCKEIKIPETGVPLCDGDSCTDVTAGPQTTQKDEICSEESGCKKPEEEVTPECTDDNCRRTDIGDQIPSQCKDSECMQQVPVLPSQETTDAVGLVTESSAPGQTVSEFESTRKPLTDEGEMDVQITESVTTKEQNVPTEQPELYVTPSEEKITTVSDQLATDKEDKPSESSESPTTDKIEVDTKTEEISTKAPEVSPSQPAPVTPENEEKMPDVSTQEPELATELPESHVTGIKTQETPIEETITETQTQSIEHITSSIEEMSPEKETTTVASIENVSTESTQTSVAHEIATVGLDVSVPEQETIPTKAPEFVEGQTETQTESLESHVTAMEEGSGVPEILVDEQYEKTTLAPRLSDSESEIKTESPEMVPEILQTTLSPLEKTEQETSTDKNIPEPEDENTKKQESGTTPSVISEGSQEPEVYSSTEPPTYESQETDRPEITETSEISLTETQEVSSESPALNTQEPLSVTVVPDNREQNEVSDIPTIEEEIKTESPVYQVTEAQEPFTNTLDESVDDHKTTRLPEQDTETSTKLDVTKTDEVNKTPEVIVEGEKDESQDTGVTPSEEYDTKTTARVPTEQEQSTEADADKSQETVPLVTVGPSNVPITTGTEESVTNAPEISMIDEEKLQTESPLSLVTKSQPDTTTQQVSISELDEISTETPESPGLPPGTPVSEQETKTEKPESDVTESQKIVTETPEQEMETKTPEQHTEESQQTELPNLNDLEKIPTETPHSLVTGQEIATETETELPEKVTEKEPFITEHLEKSTEAPTLYDKETIEPSIPESEETSTKEPKEPETEPKTESPFKLPHKETSTEIPVPIFTDEDLIETKVTEKVTEAHEPSITEEYEIGTKAPQRIGDKEEIQPDSQENIASEQEESVTKAPESFPSGETYTISEPTTIAPGEEEKVTEDLETVNEIPAGLTEKPTSPEEESHEYSTTESAQEPEKYMTQSPEITALDNELVTGKPAEFITEKQESVTESSESHVTKPEKVMTEAPEKAVTEYEDIGTTELPVSLTTKQEDIPVSLDIEQDKLTTVSEKEFETEAPEVESTEPQESEEPSVKVTKTPEITSSHETQTVLPAQKETDQVEAVTPEKEELGTTPSEVQEGEQNIQTEPPVPLVTGLEAIDTKEPETVVTEQEDVNKKISESTESIPVESPETSESTVEMSTKSPASTPADYITTSSLDSEQTSESQHEYSETTPYLVELEEHTHRTIEELSTDLVSEEPTTVRAESHYSKPEESISEATTATVPSDEKQTESPLKETEKHDEEKEAIPPTEEEEPSTVEQKTTLAAEENSEKTTEPSVKVEETTSEYASPVQTESQDEKYSTESQKDQEKEISTTSKPSLEDKEQTTLAVSSETEKPDISEEDIAIQTAEKEVTSSTTKPLEHDVPYETTAPEEEFIPAVTTKTTTSKIDEEVTTQPPAVFDKFTKPEQKPTEMFPSTPVPDIPKPGFNELQPTDEVPSPEDDGQFPPSGGYGQEPQEQDYGEEDQAFGPGTCRYGGKVYVSAQQIPRDDPCDFCFCFRSDIICLQQSCPPPIHGCHEEPIQGFCCPRYECPVSMATSLNVTTTTTTTTTTLPPHFLPHAYKGAAQRRGCQIKGHTYKVGEVVRASSGPCLHCTCGGDGQMKCDPKACTPEPMLRQMIAAAVSAKRRR